MSKPDDLTTVTEAVIRTASVLNLAALAGAAGLERTYLHQIKRGRMRLTDDVAERVRQALADDGLSVAR